ncbi:unnamed protein product [Ixodes persulcatus]
MASGSRSKQQVRLDLEVPFSKTIAPDKVGKLIVEIVKYILYEREQLPTPYDEFKRSTKQLTGDCNSAKKAKPAHPIRTVKQRRALASIDAMDLIFTSTQQLIQSNKLSQVLLVFGPTVLSPVESYVIRVPERDFACRTCGDTSAFRRCMLQVLETFRAVGQTDGGAATTKLTTFLCLRRCDVEFALMDVRPSFQVPRKGRLTVLNLSLPYCRHNDPALLVQPAPLTQPVPSTQLATHRLLPATTQWNWWRLSGRDVATPAVVPVRIRTGFGHSASPCSPQCWQALSPPTHLLVYDARFLRYRSRLQAYSCK